MPRTTVTLDTTQLGIVLSQADLNKLGAEIGAFIDGTRLKAADNTEFKNVDGVRKLVNWEVIERNGDNFTVKLTAYR
jgi:hypothetical protein